MSRQLTIDGREVAPPDIVPRGAPFTPAQQQILRILAERDITPSEAGRIVHLHRTPACARCLRGQCQWASSDGVDALKRLKARGLVRRVFTGCWSARRQ